MATVETAEINSIRLKSQGSDPASPATGYIQLYQKSNLLYFKTSTGTVNGLTGDHGQLAGLTTGDNHTQYALLAGRSGGQSLVGGTAANDDLTLQGTSHATRTSSYLILQPNGGYVGIGETAPDDFLEISGSLAGYGLHLDSSTGSGVNIDRGATSNYYGIYLTTAGTVQWHIGNPSAGNENLYIMDGLAGTKVVTVEDGSSADSVYIKSDGNVGIATAAPGDKLDVNGTIRSAKLTAYNEGDADLFVWGQKTTTNPKQILGGFNATGSYGYLQGIQQNIGYTGVPIVLQPNGGYVGIGATIPTVTLDVNGATMRLRSSRTPASAGATGAVGEICWDASYLYVCTATNTWRRVAHATW